MKPKGYQIVVQEWKGSRWQPIGMASSIENAKMDVAALVESINRPNVRARIIDLGTGRVVRNSEIKKGGS